MNKDWSSVDDKQLLMRMQEDGGVAHEACVELYLRYFNDLVGRLERMSPNSPIQIRKEVMQQVFEELYELRDYDSTDESVLSRLVRSAQEKFVKSLQGSRDDARSSLGLFNLCESQSDENSRELSSYMWASEQEGVIIDAIQYLPERQRIVTELVCIGGYDFDKVAKLLSSHVDAVRDSFKAALSSIEPVLENMLNDFECRDSDFAMGSGCEIYQDMIIDMLVNTSEHIKRSNDFYMHSNSCEYCQQSLRCKQQFVELLKSFGKYSDDTIILLESQHESVPGYLRTSSALNDQQAEQISIEDIHQGIEHLKTSMIRIDSLRSPEQ